MGPITTIHDYQVRNILKYYLLCHYTNYSQIAIMSDLIWPIYNKPFSHSWPLKLILYLKLLYRLRDIL